MNKVRYPGDEKFPFELLVDVPRTVKKSLEALNMKKIYGHQADDPVGGATKPAPDDGTLGGKPGKAHSAQIKADIGYYGFNAATSN